MVEINVNGEKEKEARVGLLRKERGLRDQPVKVKENTFEVGFIEDILVFSSAEKEGGATDIVDVTSDTFGVVKEVGDEAIAEELMLIAGDAEVVLDVGRGFFKVEGRELVTDSEALMQGAIGGKSECLSQVGLTEEDEGELRGGVEVVVEQEAELVKEVRGEEVSFINDEQEERAFAGQVRKGVVELSL
jgi:hypothetical protein